MGSDCTPVQGISICRIVPLFLSIFFYTGILGVEYYTGIIPCTGTLVRPDKNVAQGDLRVSIFCEALYSSNMSDRPTLHIIRTSEISRMFPKNFLKTRTRPFKT